MSQMVNDTVQREKKLKHYKCQRSSSMHKTCIDHVRRWFPGKLILLLIVVIKWQNIRAPKNSRFTLFLSTNSINPKFVRNLHH